MPIATRMVGRSGDGDTMYCLASPTVYPSNVSVSAVIPFGWSSRKSCAMPPANPITAPSFGPSRIAIEIVTTYNSSGRTPQQLDLREDGGLQQERGDDDGGERQRSSEHA